MQVAQSQREAARCQKNLEEIRESNNTKAVEVQDLQEQLEVEKRTAKDSRCQLESSLRAKEDKASKLQPNIATLTLEGRNLSLRMLELCNWKSNAESD